MNAVPGKFNYYTFICVSLCLISSSIEPIIVKFGYRHVVTPYQLIVIKFIVGGITVLPFIRKYPLVGFKDFKRIFLSGILLAATSALVIFSLKYLPAVIVITIITTTPAFVAIVNQILGKDILGFKFWAGFAICFIGILLSIEIHKLGAGSSAFNIIGLITVFASVVISTIYRTRLDFLTSAFPPMMVSVYMFIIDAILAVLCVPFVWPVSFKGWYIGIIIGIAAAVANITFLEAIHLMGSTRMSILGLLQRPIVIICAFLILKEPLTLVQATGIILVLVGIQMAKVTKKINK